jgi:hypothetical protein
LKNRLLSPVELKEFRLQQEKQKKIHAEELEKRRIEEEKKSKKLISPKQLLDPDPQPEIVEEVLEPEVVEKEPIEILSDRVEEISSLIKEPKYYDEEISKLELLISNKIGIDEFDVYRFKEEIEELRNSISTTSFTQEEFEKYENEVLKINEDITKLKKRRTKNYDKKIDALNERIDKLHTSGSDIFTQHGENIKELKKITHTILNDLNTINYTFEIPSILEKFDSTGILEIKEDVAATKESFYERIADLKKQIKSLPEVKYYDDELLILSEKLNRVKDSIPEVPEVRYYETEISNLQKQIVNIEKDFSNLPEVRYYENEILSLESNIKNVENVIFNLPETPEVKYYDKDIANLNRNINQIKDAVITMKLSLRNVDKTVSSIPERVDWTHEIDYLYDQIEKLKQKPVTLKETVTKEEDALAPLDQKFVTFDDLAKHYRTFILRIQQQLTSLGGGGEVNLRFLDDIDRSSIQDGRVLSYDAATKKFVFISPGAASSLWSETIGGDIYRNSYVGINSSDPQSALDVVGDVSVTGVITASSFSGEFVPLLDKTLEYYVLTGSLSTVTTSEGTKTFVYDGNGVLTNIVGTGIYPSKTFTYDGNGNLTFVDVL